MLEEGTLLSLFLAHALERLRAFLDIHELAGLSVTLCEPAGDRVRQLTAPPHFPIAEVLPSVLGHGITPPALWTGAVRQSHLSEHLFVFPKALSLIPTYERWPFCRSGLVISRHFSFNKNIACILSGSRYTYLT